MEQPSTFNLCYYAGVGVNLNDPYENFRKNKGAAFITRMKERALERSS